MKNPKTVTVIGLDAIGRQYSAVSFLNVRENWDLSGMSAKVNLSIAYLKPIWYLMGVTIQTLRELFGSCIKSRDLTREHRGRGV